MFTCHQPEVGSLRLTVSSLNLFIILASLQSELEKGRLIESNYWVGIDPSLHSLLIVCPLSQGSPVAVAAKRLTWMYATKTFVCS